MKKIYTPSILKSKLSIINHLLIIACCIFPSISFAQITNNESFDGAAFPPTGWTMSGAYPSYLFRVTSGTLPAQTPYSGAGELEWNSYNAPAGATQDLITPVIDWSGRGTNTPVVSFWFYRDVTAYDNATYDGEGVNVWVNTSASLGGTALGFVPRRGGQSASGAYLTSGTLTTVTSGWYQYVFDIPVGFNTNTNYIIFDFVSRYGNNSFMDEVQYISYLPVACTPIYGNSCSSGDYIDNFSFNTLSNMSTGCNGNTDNYIYYTTPTTAVQQGGTFNISMQAGSVFPYPQGFGVWIDYNQNAVFEASEFVYASPTADIILFSGTVVIPPVATTGVTRLRVRCNYNATVAAGDACTPFTYGETEDYTITINPVTSSYCTPTYTNLCSSNDYIDNFSFNTLSNNNSLCNGNTDNYIYYTTPTTIVQQGGAFNISMQAGSVFPYAQGFGVWIDYNQNGDFNDAGEFVYASPSAGITVFSGTIAIPQSALTGVTRMRVRCNYNSIVVAGESCSNFQFGETEDYNITINPGNPNIHFTVSTNSTCTGVPVTFTNTSTDPAAYELRWNFADGNTYIDIFPFAPIVHAYSNSGLHNPYLSVYDNVGSYLGGDSKLIDVQGTNGYFYISKDSVCPGEQVSFDPNGNAFVKWYMSDGFTSTNWYVTRTFPAIGTYTVYCICNLSCGGVDSIKRTFKVTNNFVPDANFSFYPSPSACPNEKIYFYPNQYDGTHLWNFGDGNTSNIPYPDHTYTAQATYSVTHTLTNLCGNALSQTYTISIDNTSYPYSADFGFYPNTPQCPGVQISFNSYNNNGQSLWDFGDASTATGKNPKHTYSSPGTFTVTQTITNGCGNSISQSYTLTVDNTLPVPAGIFVYAYPNIVCPGQEVQYSTDGGYNSYLWNFGDGYTANGTSYVNYTYTAAATYNASVTITNSCGNSATFSTAVTVDPNATFPGGMSMWTNPGSVCPNEPIRLETYSGYSSYEWDFGDGNTTTTVGPLVSHPYSSAGSYSVSVTVTNFCGGKITLYATATVDNNNAIMTPNIYLPNNPSCPGDAVVINVSPSNTNYVFSWDYGDGSLLDTTIGTGTSHTYTATGTYNIILTATNSCGNSATTSYFVAINNSTTPSLNPWQFGTATAVNCPGDVIVFYFEGINSNNLWDFGDGNTGVATDVFINSNGNPITTIKHAYVNTGTYTYSLTLTNQCNNSITSSNTTNVSGNMLVSGGFIISPPSGTLGYTTCGLIDMLAFGGNQYNWDFGDGTILSTTSPTMSHSYNSPGNFTVKVTITNGCGNSATYSQTLIINGVGGTTVNSSNIVFPTCYGGNNGSASVVVSGGQSPYTYVWYNNLGQSVSSNISASNLSAGTYVVAVTDNNGCTGNTSVVLSNPAAITFTTSSTQSSCGGSTGTASVSGVVGGSSPYAYSWSNGQTTSTASGLSMGSYAVIVSDVNGCSSSANASVSENGAALSVISTTNVICNGGNNGAVNINAVGGAPPYIFVWSNGATTQNINGITAGNYSVVVTDNGNCQSTINAIVSQPAAINVNPTTEVAPTCGNFDGSATANATGGNSPYTYLWDVNAASQTTQIATGLPAGTYSVTVTDASGCTKIGVMTLSNANAPIVTSVVTPISCNAMTDGSVDQSVTGGTSPYLYTWNVAPPNQQDQTNLGPGTYIVTIQDAAGCVTLKSYTMTNPIVLASSMSSTAATCSSNGTASAGVSGGTAPYTYSWTGGGATQVISNLASGNYTVSITDAHSCTAIGTVSVSSNPMTSSATPTDVTCNGLGNGSVSLTVNGGVLPYAYTWDNSATTQNISGLSQGNYSVMIMDASGCMQTQTVTVNEPGLLTTTVSVVDVTCNSLCNGTATANVSGGNTPYQYLWATTPNQTTQTATGLCPGVYNLNITDSKGCITTSNGTITEPAVLTVSVSSTPATCGNNDGTATSIPSGGTALYTYNWTGGSTMQSPAGLALGNYTVVVTDANGCTVASTTTITATTNMQAICMVTVDSTSTKNVIVWEKPVATNIDSFRIYRDIASVYTYVGGVDYSALSTFTDSTIGVNPNVTSYRYKMSLLDTCGLESTLSTFHKTIHLQVGLAVPTGYNLNWDDYLGFTVTQYRILRDTNNLGNWVPMDSVPFGITSYTDPVKWDSAGYIIEIDHPSGCSVTTKNPIPTVTNLNSSRSNIYRVMDSTVVSVNEILNGNDVLIAPNPNNGIFSVDLKNNNSGIVLIKVFSLLGEEVKKINCSGCKSKTTIDLSKQSKGVYYLQISTVDKVITKKIIIE